MPEGHPETGQEAAFRAEDPHMGWNQVKQKSQHPVFGGIPGDASFCFVHSYYAAPDDEKLVAGETEYGILICSAVARGNLVATQFHPGESGELGLKYTITS